MAATTPGPRLPELPRLSDHNQRCVFLHKSASQGKFVPESAEAYNKKDRLTLLGSSLLPGCVMKYLYMRFPSAKVGFLSLIRNYFVSKEKLKDWCRLYSLQIRLDAAPSLNVDGTTGAQSELFQAYIAASVLEYGSDKLDRFMTALLDCEPDEKFQFPGQPVLPRQGRPFSDDDVSVSLGLYTNGAGVGARPKSPEPRTGTTPVASQTQTETATSSSGSFNQSGLMYSPKVMTPLGAHNTPAQNSPSVSRSNTMNTSSMRSDSTDSQSYIPLPGSPMSTEPASSAVDDGGSLQAQQHSLYTTFPGTQVFKAKIPDPLASLLAKAQFSSFKTTTPPPPGRSLFGNQDGSSSTTPVPPPPPSLPPPPQPQPPPQTPLQPQPRASFASPNLYMNQYWSQGASSASSTTGASSSSTSSYAPSSYNSSVTGYPPSTASGNATPAPPPYHPQFPGAQFHLPPHLTQKPFLGGKSPKSKAKASSMANANGNAGKTPLQLLNETLAQRGEASYYTWEFSSSGEAHMKLWEAILRKASDGAIVSRSTANTKQEAKNKVAAEAMILLAWNLP